MLERIKQLVLGKTQDPFSKQSRQNIVLIAFLAWVGLGADGLSSSCYGPALGYMALGKYHHLAVYLALLTAVTVFLIALSYNQVIELFPNGGGGYKVAKVLLGPFAGLASGTALIIDYTLTIAISIASGVQAIFSLLPLGSHKHIILVEVLVILFLMAINLRGMKESIKILLPIFLGFVITHLIIIGYGIFSHGDQLPMVLNNAADQTHLAIHDMGLIAVMAILLRAYSLGSGTYTGLEAVSNNVNMLAQPRVRTGRVTMLYMAFSLSIMASGLILLFLLWHVQAIHGMTLNAAVFQSILGTSEFGHFSLIVLLVFEAGLLLVGGNTGFLGGPAVLANMAHDDWVPRRFGILSSRLVKQNGVLFFGFCAAASIILTDGSVVFLVVLYAINVFITFSISLFGLVKYWLTHRDKPHWIRSLTLASLGYITCIFILLVTFITKFDDGSWITILTTGGLMAFCYFLKRRYKRYDKLKQDLNKSLEIPLEKIKRKAGPLDIDPKKPTAVFLAKDIGATLHTVLWVERMFPKHFKNYLFLSYGRVDTDSFGSENTLNLLKQKTQAILDYLVKFANYNGIAAMSVEDYGADPMHSVPEIAEKIAKDYNNNVFFMAQYIYGKENLLTRFMHSDFTENMQRALQNSGIKLLIVPLNLSN